MPKKSDADSYHPESKFKEFMGKDKANNSADWPWTIESELQVTQLHVLVNNVSLADLFSKNGKNHEERYLAENMGFENMIFASISHIELAGVIKREHLQGERWSKSRPCFSPDEKTQQLASLLIRIRELSEREPQSYPKNHMYELARNGDQLMLFSDYDQEKE